MFAGKGGKTALMWASSKVSEIVVQALIDAAVNINAVDENNNPAIIYAAEKGKIIFI